MPNDVSDRDEPSMKITMCFSAFALIGILISQRYFRNQFTVFAIELPRQTQFAVSYIPPAIIAGCIILALIATVPQFIRFRTLCQKLSFIICSLVIGHHIIAMTLAYITGPGDLSLILPESRLLNTTFARREIPPRTFGINDVCDWAVAPQLRSIAD